MKNVAIINVVKDKSTGKIAVNLLNELTSKGYNALFFFGRGEKASDIRMMRIDTPIETYIHAFLARLTGLQGSFSWFATKRMLKQLKKHSIDTVILINPHAYYLNEKLLYNFMADNNIRFISIIPDEYAYLGNCAVDPPCERYKTGCGKCPNIHLYPNSWFFDSCHIVMRRKEQCYRKLKRARFIGPSFVINNLNNSYLGKYMSSSILDEAIDIELYHPQDSSNLKNELGIDKDKVVILCIAPPYKGIEYFKQVAMRFKGDDRYVFVHVGKDENALSESNYIHINYVKENSQLALYYSMADLFLFPSLADTMSNACLEALACGTPLLVFNISGMPYLLDDTVGTIVEPRNVEQLAQVVAGTRRKTDEVINTCRKYAEKRYDSRLYSEKVIEIAESII